MAKKIKQDSPADMRARSGKNQTDFWKPYGISQSAASRMERGERGVSKPVRMLIALSTGKATIEQLQSGELARSV